MACEYVDEMSHGPDEIKKVGKILGYDNYPYLIILNLNIQIFSDIQGRR